jgi:flagellar basal body-associated protein FliL
MLKTKIIIANFILIVVLGTAVFAQSEEPAQPLEQETILPRQALVERDNSSSLIYMIVGIAIGVAGSSGVGYFFYNHRKNGTENDRDTDLPTPVNIHSHDKLANKHGDLQPPHIEKHGNEFM